MQYDGLKFTVKDIMGHDTICEIYSLAPKNENEFYVVYSDKELDENNNIIFKYGLFEKNGDSYYISGNVSDDELEYIKEEFNEDIKSFINEIKENA